MTVRCLNCKHADWARTPSGRIKAKVAGRCQAELPSYPLIRCVSPAPVAHKNAIWPDYEGVCALFEELP